MDTLKNRIEDFFDDYARRFNAALVENKVDPTEAANSFANCFVEASPLGITCAANDENFLKSIPKGYAFYKSIGTLSMTINSKEITLIDDYHSMVKIHWLSEYEKKDKRRVAIDFNVFYLVQHFHKDIKIFAYITGDEQKVLREYDLI